jgi:hypothetical protein
MPDIRSLLTPNIFRFIAATVVLGAVGSGAWEWVLKPSLVGLSEFGLNVATLGVKSFKDALYSNVARGLHEESSVTLYVTVVSFVPGFLLGAFLAKARPRKAGAAEENPSFMAKHSATMAWLILLSFYVIFTIHANQLSYVNRAITHVHQLFAIVDPYIQESERLMYRSEFSQVSSSGDYIKLTTKLEAICLSKKLKAPKFVIW